MLSNSCPICEGFGLINDADKGYLDCSCEHGFVNAEPTKKVYVNVYKVTREFGGHEEGGWYYNDYTCLETVPCKNKFSDEIADELLEQYAHVKHGNIYSVLGGADVVVLIEETMKESETRERPRYE